MIVISIEPTNRYFLLRSAQFSIDVAVLSTVVGFDPEAAIGPELSLGAEAMGVCRMAINRAARMGPIDGIWRSRLLARCLALSVNKSRRTSRRKQRSASNCW